MRDVRNVWALCLLACLSLASGTVAKEQVLHEKTYFSEGFEMASGDVFENYKLIEMPEGHIALRNLFAEVVDENGDSVPLYEVYLHHWVVMKFFVRKGHKELLSPKPKMVTDPNLKFNLHGGHAHRIQFQEGADVKKEERHGSCIDDDITYYGVGSETRQLNLSLPAPYGKEAGNPASIPEGYEEAWYLDIHAIDTRGAVDAVRGGVYCCYDGTHCAVKENSAMPSRKLFLKYTITWVDMDETVIPVRTFVLDATDPRTSLTEEPYCAVEYEIPGCSKDSESKMCIDHRHSIAAIPEGGILIQGSLHQHVGGMGGIVTNKDGLVLCQSDPIYGKGTKPGDEAGYVVGMTVCFPEPGSVNVAEWELLHFDAFYSGEQPRTGVMSVFTLLVADPLIKEVIH